MAKQSKRGLSLGGKILLTVLFLVLVSAGVGGIAFYGFHQSNLHLSALADQQIPELALTDDTDYQVARARRYEKEFFLFSSLGKRNKKILSKQKGYHEKLLDRYRIVGDNIRRLKESVARDPALSATVAKIERAHANTLEALTPMAQRLLKGASFLDVAPQYKVYKAHVHALEDGVKELRSAILGRVDSTKTEVTAFRKFLSTTLLGVSGGVIVLGLVIGLIASNRISYSLANLVTGAKKIASGNYEPIEVTTSDELAEIADVLNETVDKLKDYIQTEEEREQAQQNVINFLDVVHRSSEGDLSVRAPVTADVFGNIADAYNLMASNLENLLRDVRQNAEQVGEESRRLMGIFDIMKQGTETQLQQVGEATSAVQATSELSSEVSHKVTQAREAAGAVDAVTSEGHDLVLRNTEGMQLIRATVQVINRKMKSLAERMGEIETISQLIGEVSSRTTILAMNASIEAASTGARGTGFLVIADEIKKLADKTAEATKQINSVVKAIQTETNEVSSSLEEQTRTVEEQAALMQETGGAFRKIEKAIQESNRVVGEIAEMSDRQRELSQRVASAIGEVSGVSNRTRDLVDSSAEISKGLADSSGRLLGLLSRFRLSDAEEEETPTGAGETAEPAEGAEAVEVNFSAGPPTEAEIEAGLGYEDGGEEADEAEAMPVEDPEAVEENLWEAPADGSRDSSGEEDFWTGGSGVDWPGEDAEESSSPEDRQQAGSFDFEPTGFGDGAEEPGQGEKPS